MPDTPQRRDPVDRGVIFSGAAAQRIADATKWVEANARNRQQLQPVRNRPTNTEVFQARCTSGTLDAAGYYPAVITRYDPVATAWTDFATCHLAPLNGETLVSGTRYGVRPIGPASDGTPVFQVLGGASSGGGSGVTGGGGLTVTTVSVDYTQLTPYGAVSTITGYPLISPMPSRYIVLGVGFSMAANQGFWGGSIGGLNVTFHFSAATGGWGSFEWHLANINTPAIQWVLTTPNAAGNWNGATTDDATLTLAFSGDTANHLTQGHATCLISYLTL